MGSRPGATDVPMHSQAPNRPGPLSLAAIRRAFGQLCDLHRSRIRNQQGPGSSSPTAFFSGRSEAGRATIRRGTAAIGRPAGMTNRDCPLQVALNRASPRAVVDGLVAPVTHENAGCSWQVCRSKALKNMLTAKGSSIFRRSFAVSRPATSLQGGAEAP